MAQFRLNSYGVLEYIDPITALSTGEVQVPSLKVGDPTGSHLYVDSNGVMVQRGGSTMWDDSMVPAGAFRTGGTALTFDNLTTNLFAYRIDVGDILHLSTQLPHSMKKESVVMPHIHLVNKNAIGAAGYNVAFKFTYVWAKIGSVFAGEQGEAEVRCSFQNATALTHKLCQFADVTPTAAQDGISSVFICAVERISASVENYATSDIFVLGFDLHYEKDTIGSREPASK